MKHVQELHRRAMEQTDYAIEARANGDEARAIDLFASAFQLEREAAEIVASDHSNEPTRSVLLRSAATLALDCGKLADAERLVCLALSGSPPAEIAEELRDIYEQVNFQRHLALRGVGLASNEIQLSIAGNSIGFGVAPTAAFLRRVEMTENLLYRTAERLRGMEYREASLRGQFNESTIELFLSVPRAASFAITIRVAKPQFGSSQMPSFAEQVIDELMLCLDHFARNEEDLLKARIVDPAYIVNFLGIAQAIAPDGHDVSLVGFTAQRAGNIRNVELTESAIADASIASWLAPDAASLELVMLSGYLKLAEAHDTHLMIMVDTEGVEQFVHVPYGLMADVVKPLLDGFVTVTCSKSASGLRIEKIQPSAHGSYSN